MYRYKSFTLGITKQTQYISHLVLNTSKVIVLQHNNKEMRMYNLI